MLNYWYHKIQKSNKLDFIILSRGHVCLPLKITMLFFNYFNLNPIEMIRDNINDGMERV